MLNAECSSPNAEKELLAGIDTPFDLTRQNTLHFYGLPVLACPVRDTPPFREGLLPGSGKCKRTKSLDRLRPQCARRMKPRMLAASRAPQARAKQPRPRRPQP